LGEDLKDLVRCYSGSQYAERPTALYWENQWLEVSSVEAQWCIPGGKAFRVHTRDNHGFELLWREVDDEWKIIEI
jgi:hypothetical protein